MQVKNNPYFSHADKQLVVAEHESKRLTDPLHIAIDLDMRALAKANSRKGARVQRFFDVSTMRKDSYADAALLVALDYNTVRMGPKGGVFLTVHVSGGSCFSRTLSTNRSSPSCLGRRFSSASPASCSRPTASSAQTSLTTPMSTTAS